MVNKIIEYDVELLSTKQKNQYTLPTVFTNDLDSVEFRFNITDTTLDLALATADVLLYMHDGSFFQNTSESGVTIEGNTVKYLLKENEGNHSGTSEVQIIVKNGGPEYASQLYKFHIQKGLESVVATEVMIHDWTTLTRTAQEYINEFYANEATRQSMFDTGEATRTTTFDTNETGRATTFTTNETARQSSHDDLQTVVNTSEDIRVANENTRIVSESDREASEVTRIANEDSRLSVEAARVEAEDIRSAFYTGFDSKLEATQLQTAKNTKNTSDLTNQISNVNVNQEATQTVETNADIASLPVNAGNGALDASLEGMTATQLIKNGDFSDGLTGWNSYGAPSQTVSDKVLTVSGATSPLQMEYEQIEYAQNNKYFLYAKMRASEATSIQILYASDLFSSIPVATVAPGANTWVEVYTSFTTQVSEATLLRLYYRSGNTSGTETLEIDGNAGVFAINMTQLGIEDYTEDQMLTLIRNGYFEGTQTVTPGRVKSVGKNLFDKAAVVPGTINHTTGDDQTSVTFMRSQYISIKPMTYYRLSRDALDGFSWGWYVYDAQYNKITGNQGYSTTNTIHVAPNNAISYIRLLVHPNIKNVQLEENSLPTPYEPYTETLQYIEPVTLNRLPNGVADEITGSGDFVQRVGEVVIKESSTIGYLSNPADLGADVIRFTPPVDIATSTSSVTGQILAENWDSYVGSASAIDRVSPSNIGKAYYMTSNIDFIVAMGSYPSVTEAKASILGTKIWYQLATPIIHPNVTSGNLIAHPKGTVYFEQFQANAGIYSAGISISNPDLPIKSLERLSVVDWMTGEERDLDVSKAVLTDTSITHPELIDGDLVFFTYEFSAPGPNGAKTLSFYDSRYTIKDTATGSFFKWDIQVTNGVPNIVLKGV